MRAIFIYYGEILPILVLCVFVLMKTPGSGIRGKCLPWNPTVFGLSLCHAILTQRTMYKQGENILSHLKGDGKIGLR
jgi:hypothetical protein